MLRFGILFILIAVVSIIYRNMDHSKEAQLRRLKIKADIMRGFRKHVYEPVNDVVYQRLNADKIQKKEETFHKAGLKVSYTTSIFLSLSVAIISAVTVYIVLGNPFMAIVFIGIGWNIPTVILNFFLNKRLRKLDDQIGMWMRMVIKRYEVINDFYGAFMSTIADFAGEEPIYSELIITRNNIERGDSISDGLHDLAKRIDNKYMMRFADYYAITSDIGTEEARHEVLAQALLQYQEHVQLTRELNKQLSELAMEAYIMLGFVPGVVVYQIMTDPTYIEFMTKTLLGQFGSAIIAALWLICFWVVSAKISAPLDKD